MTPERQNMTKPEAVTQEAALDDLCQAVADEWGQGSQEHNIARDFVTLAKREIQAAEQRGAKRERERCLREAEDADPLGKDAFGMREYIAQAIRQGEQA